MKEIKYLVVHHTGDITAGNQFEKTKRYHTQDLHWRDIGYHFLIEKSGQVRKGRSERTQGAHAKNYNTVSLGVALAGDFTREQPTKAQINSLVALLATLHAKYPQAEIVPHKQLNNTDCPGSLDVAGIAQRVQQSHVIVPIEAGMSEKAIALAVITFGIAMLKKLL